MLASSPGPLRRRETSMAHIVCKCAKLVLSPDPTSEREKGLVYVECFLGLFLNSEVPIRFAPCDLHVIIMWYPAIANYICAWERLMHCHAQTMRYHDNHMTCYSCTSCPKKRSMYTRPFPSLRAGSGNETTGMWEADQRNHTGRDDGNCCITWPSILPPCINEHSKAN